jgi:tetratricopeptide (TPR) repeat protein
MRLILRFCLIALLFSGSISWADEPLSPPVAVESSSAEALSEPSHPSFEELFQNGKLDLLKIDRRLERSDLSAAYLVQKAEEAVKRGNLDEAVTLGEKAVSLSAASPLPHFFLSRVYWTRNKADIPNILSEYFLALSLAVQDFWFLVSMVGTLLLLLLSAALLTFVGFSLYSFFSYTPLWIHQISETSRGYLHPISSGIIFISILSLPLILELPIAWSFLFFFLLFWGFYNRSEKGIVFTFLIGLGAAAWLLPFFLTFFSAKSSVLLNEMVRNHQADFYWSPPQAAPGPVGWEEKIILASYQAQEGNSKKAEAFYREALSAQPQSALALNNLGNLSFYAKDYPAAIEHYRQAIELAPKMVSPYYNLSQTYREMLAFDEGNKLYQQASAIDQKSVEQYAQKATLYPGFPLIEERFTKMDLWQMLLKQTSRHVEASEKIWRGWIGSIPLNQSPVVSISALVAFILASLLFERFYTARPCVTCHKAICKRCHQSIFSYKVCGACGLRFKSIRKKIDFGLIEEEAQKIPLKFYPFFLFPGGGHLAIRKSGRGFLMLGFFCFLISYFWLGEIFFSSTQWHLNSAKWVWVPFWLLMLYLISIIDLARCWSRRSWP